MNCPRLDSLLASLLAEQDPIVAAQRLNIPTDQGRVLVLIGIAGAHADQLDKYGVTVTGQSGEDLQAFAPFDQLCALANDASVRYVSAPAVAVPQ